jgi:hypothetical protein
MCQVLMGEGVTWLDEAPQEVEGHLREMDIQPWLHPSLSLGDQQ